MRIKWFYLGLFDDIFNRDRDRDRHRDRDSNKLKYILKKHWRTESKISRRRKRTTSQRSRLLSGDLSFSHFVPTYLSIQKRNILKNQQLRMQTWSWSHPYSRSLRTSSPYPERKKVWTRIRKVFHLWTRPPLSGQSSARPPWVVRND